ncbi:MAG: dNTP triphosphohydrolase, partial [Candidatus Peregrinibacteria bacterium]|nr:dNTP triphosphohydrolase [Candidatus Peregrinibacteria bacterium]
MWGRFDAHLAGYAQKNGNSRGRKFTETPDPNRLPFQRDRDRILHTTSFRRLKGKMQVVAPSLGDHFRNRLSHTLEVSQIARDLCRELRLNEDLAEAIALAHDLGHPPFGHSGEMALDQKMKKFGKKFDHNAQSLRMVESFENRYPNFSGLNLSFEVLEGIQKHETFF